MKIFRLMRAEATRETQTQWNGPRGERLEEEAMAVRKICKQKGCRASPRCDHPWWFDVMHAGKRWRMSVDDGL